MEAHTVNVNDVNTITVIFIDYATKDSNKHVKIMFYIKNID